MTVLWPSWLVLAGTALCAGQLAAQSPAPASSRALPHTRVVLRNGLVAIMNEDHATPLVAVSVWYHFGSKDDPPGHAGLAHLCEHLMAQGSPNLGEQQQGFYRSIGGSSARWGQTTEDVTKYSVVVPSNQLETVLWAESDRMAAPLVVRDAQQLSAVRALIAQERRQDVENVPFGISREVTLAALFPAGHPYHVSAATPAADLNPGSPADVRAACGAYYVPNNAEIALSGDFDSEQARRWIEHYFGGIPAGHSPSRVSVPTTTLGDAQRLVLEDARALQPQLHMDWVGASYANPDRPALLALAFALSEDRFGRLTKLLVHDRQLAARVIVDNYDLENSGVFEIAVVPQPGASMTLIEKLVDSTLSSVQASSPITRQEVARFTAANSVDAATSLETKFARADTLAHDQVFAGDPTSYAKQAVAAARLTPADVQRVARRYLTARRVVLSLVPAGKLDLVSRPDLPYVNVTPTVPQTAPAKP